MNQVFGANKKQPHGMKSLGAVQAKKEGGEKKGKEEKNNRKKEKMQL